MNMAHAIKKNLIALLLPALVFAFTSTASAARLTGSLKGIIIDKEGFPLPGAFIYISSPSLLGIQNYITSDRGGYAFIHLPPGIYKMTVEMPGFKTVNIEKIQLEAGKAMKLDVSLEATDIEEEITSLQAAPMIDSQSAKIAPIAGQDILRYAPLTRNFSSIVQLAPGIIADETYPDRYFAVHGSTVRANTFAIDGVNITDPLTLAPPANLNIDVIEEVEFEDSAHPADTYPSEGGFINIVAKSGSNNFLGNFLISHASQTLSRSLWSPAEVSEKQAAAPAKEQRQWDFSLNLGGPFMEDRAWFFANLRLGLRSQATPFLSWKDPFGTTHEPFRWRNRDLLTFFKVSSQVTSQYRATLTVYHTDRYQAVFERFLSLDIPKESSQTLDHESSFFLNGNLNYRINQDTFMDVTLGIFNHSTPLTLHTDAKTLPSYRDASSGRIWGSGPFNQRSAGRRLRAAASITRLQNSLMGISHELKIGAEYEGVSGSLSTWKDDNLLINYSSDSPYLFGTDISPLTGKPVGKGLISFYLAGKTEKSFLLKTEMKRLGLYAQDVMNIGRRVTLHLGLRFDRSVGRLPTLIKGQSGNAVSIEIGKNLINPISNVNPYGSATVSEWDSMMTWNTLSPRIGLSVDLVGTGKSVFKASFSRYSEYLSLNYLQEIAPLLPTRSHRFYWYDEDGNGRVDATDTYALFADDYRIYDANYYKKRISPNAKSPRIDEWTIGFHQELLKDLSVSCQFIAKKKTNILENVLYDPDSGKTWYSNDPPDSNWWIPFKTIVPGADDYPDTPVTVYYRSLSAPAVFDRLQNVPQLKQKYGAFELTIKKRMSNNWQFYGFLIWSRTSGNVGLDVTASSGFSPAAGSPNSFVNIPENSRLDLDRPAVIRLLGTYRFPLDFDLTLSYSRWSGAPWGRTVTIVPPDSWTQANSALAEPVTVSLEKPGARRFEFRDTMDMRIEKEFVLRTHKRMTLSVDVFNLLGRKISVLDLNDGGFWFPGAENSLQGIRQLSSTFGKYLSLFGTRKVQISLSLEF